MTPATSPGLNIRLLSLVEEEGLADKRVLDVGCGWGGLALALAPHALAVIGLDRRPDRRGPPPGRRGADRERGVP